MTCASGENVPRSKRVIVWRAEPGLEVERAHMEGVAVFRLDDGLRVEEDDVGSDVVHDGPLEPHRHARRIGLPGVLGIVHDGIGRERGDRSARVDHAGVDVRVVFEEREARSARERGIGAVGDRRDELAVLEQVLEVDHLDADQVRDGIDDLAPAAADGDAGEMLAPDEPARGVVVYRTTRSGMAIGKRRWS